VQPCLSSLPAYSPDFNPIEQPIGKLKAYLRKLGPRSLRSLTAGLRAGLKLFSPAECADYLRHAGYGQPNRKVL
jgi:transposase